jgi:hypothetical protein
MWRAGCERQQKESELVNTPPETLIRRVMTDEVRTDLRTYEARFHGGGIREDWANSQKDKGYTVRPR